MVGNEHGVLQKLREGQWLHVVESDGKRLGLIMQNITGHVKV